MGLCAGFASLGRRTDYIWLRLPFQGCLCGEQPWAIKPLEQEQAWSLPIIKYLGSLSLGPFSRNKLHYMSYCPLASLHHPVELGVREPGGEDDTVGSAIALSSKVFYLSPTSLVPSSIENNGRLSY